ncbi:hypothetical protein I317_04948 [Kwoniella heveanensis CBS 569]|uniref:Uncharacterized protein n=1 Tax=Kwoniella heveanensis BCC8398 TaxID=1296120 RepID=A0A1B9GWL5_9TREE|nr:hypothetical protein I316_02984 [Kwoniella heveanensis BCC8398]OCF41202.1 hypothetical protein I317_04948 [Kwoniella heveanensis CBS 569]
MSGFLRRASLSKKKGLNDDGANAGDAPRGPSVRGDKPPKSRSVSEASAVSENGDNGKTKRKASLGTKGRKRLSSLFSSSSLSSYTSDKDGSPGPTAPPSAVSGSASTSSRRPSSHLNVSTSSSGASTPTSVSGVPAQRHSTLNGKGVPSDLKDGLHKLTLGTNTVPLPLSASPSQSPTNLTSAGPPVQPVRASSSPETAMNARERRTSMYSQWNLEEVGLDSDSDDDDAFLTPSEGLSEVEEEDENEVETPSVAAAPKPATVATTSSVTAAVPPTPTSNATTDIPLSEAAEGETKPHIEPTNVEKGARAQEDDVCGTGPSTIKRNKPTIAQTKVVRHVAASKAGALSVDQSAVLAKDIDTCREALTLFLTSRMKEAEEYCLEKEGEGHHMYLQSAQGIIQALKGMMTFDSIDLANALEITKATAVTASALRRPSDSIVSRFVRSGTAVARIKAMTPLERHAELVFAETSLMKAVLAIVSGGDWLGLVREALNMRNAHGIYHVLQQYLDDADKNGYDDNIDMDFRSGVVLGSGTSALMLSLLPGKVIRIAEILGLAGNKETALDTLMSAGGWSRTSDTPAFDETNEGLRRPVCDLILLTFHLVISVLMPVSGVDIGMARKILAYNMRRYPDGVFFLYFQARLYTAQCQPEEANKSLQRALDQKLEYIQLQHMVLWDYACNHMMLSNWKGALDCFSILKDESNWSRCTYTYAAAAAIVQLAQEGDGKSGAKISEAEKLMHQVPKLTKKMVGKSLPIEKLVSRKARKFHSQNNRLFLPSMELAYVFGSLLNTPRRSLLDDWLPKVNNALKKLDEVEPEHYGNGNEFWDDYCLGHFLRGMVQSVARYQNLEAAPEATRKAEGDPSDEALDEGAEKDYRAVIRHSPEVQLDHYILFHNYYELGRLYARRGDDEQAKECFEVVMSGKLPEHNAYMAKAHGKYSLEGALLLKTHAALSAIKDKEKQ